MCLQALLSQSVFTGSVEMEGVCRLCCDGVCSQALLKWSFLEGSVEMEYVRRFC